MSSMKTWLVRAAILGLGFLARSASAQTLTLTLDSVVPWKAFAGHAGSKSFENEHAGMLNFTVTSQSGPGFGYADKLSLFCVELQQDIALHSQGNVYSIVSAAQASSGIHAGYSANIPLAGIGTARTSNLEVLYAHAFGTNYNPASLSDTNKSAFQLAVWELSHDDDFKVTSGSSTHFWITDHGAAVTEAQTLVNWVKANAATAPKMQLSALHNSTTQDFLIPTMGTFSSIPEPSTYALVASLAVMSAVAWRRRGSAIS
jgi:hypothetical protein